jgi:hypothetical protein
MGILKICVSSRSAGGGLGPTNGWTEQRSFYDVIAEA